MNEVPKNKSANSALLFLYSVVCYAVSVASLGYFILFCSDLYEPVSVNSQAARNSVLTAMLGNVGLLLLFGVQHSVMARSSFKQWSARFLPRAVERSTYCLATSLVLVAIPLCWMPVEGFVWEVTSPLVVALIYGGSALGWSILLLATFQIGHFELFGVKQAYFLMLGRPVPQAVFKEPGLYQYVRHPIQLGVLMGMWLVPVSTLNHVMLSTGMTLYVLVGLYFEERDLMREYGARYRDYRKRVAKLFPFVV